MKNISLFLFFSLCTSIFAAPKLKTIGKILKGVDVAGDIATAAEIFQSLLSLAQGGDAESQFKSGNAYYFGEGVPQDYKEAVKWYTKAAEQGHAAGEYNLGNHYCNGEGVPQDYKQAIKWFTKAAEQGLANAQYNLGLMYNNGEGVPQDYKEAVKWYTKAAEQGDTSAQFNLALMYENGKGVTQDYREAVKWYTKAAEQGHIKAKNNLKELQEKIRDNLTKIETQLNDKKKVITQLKTTGIFTDSSKGKYLVFKDDSDQKNYLLFNIQKVGDLKGKRVRINANIKPTKDGASMFIPHINSINLIKE